MKTLFNKLKAFCASPLAHTIVAIVAVVALFFSYIYLWVLQTLLMGIAHAALVLLIWAIVEILTKAENFINDLD